MTVHTLHVTEMPALTTRPSVTSLKKKFIHIILEVWVDFKCVGSQIDWWTGNWYVWFKYDLGQKYYAPQVRHDRGFELTTSTSWQYTSCHWDPALTTRPSVTSYMLIYARAIIWASVTLNYFPFQSYIIQSCLLHKFTQIPKLIVVRIA